MNTLSWRNDLEWLAEQQIVFPVCDEIKPELESQYGEDGNLLWNVLRFALSIKQMSYALATMLKFQFQHLDAQELPGAAPRIISEKLVQQLKLDPENVKESLHAYQHKLREKEKDIFLSSESAYLSILAIQMEMLENVTVVPLISSINQSANIPKLVESTAAEIVIKKLPLPNGLTPWEEILDYRNDPETQKSLRALRKWIRKISSEQLSVVEFEEELQSLIDEFETHMKLHKMKANTETLETIVKAPLEILEDIVKLKFSKIPEPFFAIRKRQIMLMEAEINAPGKEISYLIKANEAFSDSD